MATERGDGTGAPGGAPTPTALLVHLEVPVGVRYVGLARAVVIAAATVVPWVDDDRLEDLRLAVSEACTRALSGQGEQGGGRLALHCELDGEWLRVDVEDVGDGPRPEPAGDEVAWGSLLIGALVDEATFDSVPGGRRVRLALHRPPPS